jgi:mannitol 2-dehydrogenase
MPLDLVTVAGLPAFVIMETVLKKLSQLSLGSLDASIAIPKYDRSAVRPGIVHFGLGNFHRVHQGVYVDRCLHRPGNEGWGICGVELIDNPGTQAKAEAYRGQDCLYSVTEYAPDGAASTRVIGAMVEYLHAPADPEAVLARLTNPDTKIVSLTITEGGYNLDETTGVFKVDTPDVAHDLSGGPLRTAFGYIAEALRRRREQGIAPFTVMSCDNLRHNGDTARKAIVSFARAKDAALADWIDTNVDFPNSMVDRIAPQVPPAVRDRLNQRSGIDDAVPALGETFIQWVLEDDFRGGRPPFDEVGVELRNDVPAFEFMKGRMLNASHILLAMPGIMLGYRIVHEALGDTRLYRLLETFLDRDAIPRIEGPKGVSLEAYKKAVLERFSNPAINDQLLRIAFDTTAKIPVFHSRTIEMLLKDGGDLRREAFFLACFGAYLTGKDDKGDAFEVVEPRLTENDWVLLRSGNPVDLLRTSPFEKLGLADHAAFAKAYGGYVASIQATSVGQTLEALLAETA